MQKFLDQFFPDNPMMALNMETFIFYHADSLIKDYNGGNWESMDIGGVRILIIPGKTATHTINVESSGNSVTTDKNSASAAFTSLVVNWFWHRYVRSLNPEEFNRFHQYHNTLRDAIYSDTPVIPLNTDDIFTLTD